MRKTLSVRGGKTLKIIKRDWRVVDFDAAKIEIAIEKAMVAAGELDLKLLGQITNWVVKKVKARVRLNHGFVPTVEGVQDVIEEALIMNRLASTAKSYILYRQKRHQVREAAQVIPPEVQEQVLASQKYFPNPLSEFVYYSMYARWLPDKGRRETWVETIDRYIDFMRGQLGAKLSTAEYAEIREYMLEMKAMGSMRLLWSAGEAAGASNVCAYNCAYIAPASWQDFGEIMYISMCGTGVGFSCERQTVEMLPIIKPQTGQKLKTHVVGDSKEGWCEALIRGLRVWSRGQDIDFDYSQVRPKGARLKTMGGRASGPEPLHNLMDFARSRILLRQRRHLTTLDVHDIICKIGEIVVAGGVRRSALISLSDLDDEALREAKNGQFYLTHPERSMANNSAVYNERPTTAQFLEEWVNLVKSGTGERGIFNRGSLKKQLPKRRWAKFEAAYFSSGVNPCGEIILRSKQFCNLSVAVARADDTLESLSHKVRVATILGTFQASLTDFPFLSKQWQKNCQEEALLGVDVTGQWDCPVIRNPKAQAFLKRVAVKTNRTYARRFGINAATAVTCNKPSGNTSQLFNCASGIHPRYAPYYIRRVRIQAHDPLFQLMKDKGVPFAPEVGQTEATATTFVLEFPVKAPKGAVFKDDLTALDQLKYWQLSKVHYTEHNPSVTISVGEAEWLAVGDWVYRNWDIVGGLSFLPRSDYVYKLAPYEEISRQEYEARLASFPKINFAQLMLYEQQDQTTGAKEYACVAGLCEIEPLPEASKSASAP